MLINDKELLWAEKYRPQRIEDMILPSDLKDKFKNNDICNMLLASETPGTGKTSLTNAIIKQNNLESLFINASLESSIETLRGKIKTFASQRSFNGLVKVVILDECLEENEEIIIIENGKEVPIKLNQMEKGKIYECLSFNMDNGEFEKDSCEIISDKIDDIYEVELEDGRKIKVTSNHPFIIKQNEKFAEKTIDDGLQVGDEIVCLDTNSKLKNIKKSKVGKVINLTVHKNHTFITKNGIVTHNCDNYKDDFQFAFRGVIEEFSANCRFLLTCNYAQRIIEPIRNRLEVYNFDVFMKTPEMTKEIFKRLCYILDNEGINYNKENLIDVIRTFNPSIRKMIIFLQQCAINNKLIINADELIKADGFNYIINILKQKNYDELVQQCYGITNPDNFYSWVYKNINNFNANNRPQIILNVAKYQDISSRVRDKNLNLCACLTEMVNLV